jgi:hypothetical protein
VKPTVTKVRHTTVPTIVVPKRKCRVIGKSVSQYVAVVISRDCVAKSRTTIAVLLYMADQTKVQEAMEYAWSEVVRMLKFEPYVVMLRMEWADEDHFILHYLVTE